MPFDWKTLIDRLDKKPMSVLLGLTLGLAAWALMNWRDEVTDHKADLRKTYEALEKTNDLQNRLIQYYQENNERSWKKDTLQLEH